MLLKRALLRENSTVVDGGTAGRKARKGGWIRIDSRQSDVTVGLFRESSKFFESS